MKKFCKNCEYSHWWSPLRCHNPITPVKKNPYTEEIEKHWWKDDFNKNGECPYYKRKWWKITEKSE